MVSINELAGTSRRSRQVSITTTHIDGPQGVRGRNSDNARLRDVLGWEPATTLESGLATTYAWIEAQVRQNVLYADAAGV